MNLVTVKNNLKNRPISRIILAVFFLFSTPLFAEAISIGVVNINKIMEQAPQAERSSINLKAKFLPIEENLAEQTIEIKKLMATKAEISSSDEKLQMERKLRTLKRAHSRALEDFREEFRFARDRALDKVQNEVYDAIHVVRRQLGLDLIVQEYVSADPRIDITSAVLQYLRKKMQEQQSNRNKSNNDNLNTQ
ncbi:MAG TPA: OmpH family outer membrane protein [Leucothrix mucor]|uniref:OmpH family outer membrane protein n=1 Tax=Leucothrix mucor TaxID=45248 RepID=A0A7V2WW08_LEUMU|nr:OmpH family outer membrane protein [Leucothrix mucor]